MRAPAAPAALPDNHPTLSNPSAAMPFRLRLTLFPPPLENLLGDHRRRDAVAKGGERDPRLRFPSQLGAPAVDGGATIAPWL
jgi:hypothetical protein